MYKYLTTLWFLYVAHAVTDVVGQSEHAILMRKRKADNPHWFYWLLAHGLLNGFGVYLVTQNEILGMAETFLHMLIDYNKDMKWISLRSDQLLHFVCKIAWSCISL